MNLTRRRFFSVLGGMAAAVTVWPWAVKKATRLDPPGTVWTDWEIRGCCQTVRNDARNNHWAIDKEGTVRSCPKCGKFRYQSEWINTAEWNKKFPT